MNDFIKKVIIVSIALIGILLLTGFKPAQQFGGLPNYRELSGTAASSTIAVVPISTSINVADYTKIVSTSSRRAYLALTATTSQASSEPLVWLSFGDVPPAIGSGIPIFASTTFVIDASNLITGAVRAVGSATNSISVLQFNY